MIFKGIMDLLDATVFRKSPIDRLIDRVQEERLLGYYESADTDDVFKVVIKWAEKYKDGEED